MLTVPQIEALRYENPYLYEALKRIVAALNSLGVRLKMDPHPAAQAVAGQTVPPPAAPASITVTGARGVFTVTLAAGAGNSTPIFYFVEAADNTAFINATVYPLGGSLVANLALGNVTRYWRARAKYIESDYSPYIYFGTQANPSVVSGGLTGSGDVPPNVPLNYTNNATVDSIDAGASATVRIYGPGGVGSSWIRYVGAATQTYAGGTITGLAYTTAYWVMWTGSAYQAFTTLPASLPDGYVFAGKVTTVASGGTGGSTGGGGGSGGSGGRLLQ